MNEVSPSPGSGAASNVPSASLILGIQSPLALPFAQVPTPHSFSHSQKTNKTNKQKGTCITPGTLFSQKIFQKMRNR